MATLPSDRLLRLLLAALPGAKLVNSPSAPKPAVLTLPDLGEVRVYLWTTTPDRSTSGRPLGEHKSQIIIPGTPYGGRQSLDLLGMPTFLMGYSPIYGVFIFWEASKHEESSYSTNLQVRETLLEEAMSVGWGIDSPRRTARGLEVRAAVHPSHLFRYLKMAIAAGQRSLSGNERATFLAAHAPELDDFDLAQQTEAGKQVSLETIIRARGEMLVKRLRRAPGFSKSVLDQFDYRCAVCSVQLGILEGAHIIPVHDPRGSDEIWEVPPVGVEIG